jgi:hypothetical protein
MLQNGRQSIALYPAGIINDMLAAVYIISIPDWVRWLALGAVLLAIAGMIIWGVFRVRR